MKSTCKAIGSKGIFRFVILLTAAAAILVALVSLPFDTGKAAPGISETVKELYRRPAPNFDLNASLHLPNVRHATSAQLSALNNLKASVNSPNMTTRWNDFGGSPDVMYDFASQPYTGTPEQAPRGVILRSKASRGMTCSLPPSLMRWLSRDSSPRLRRSIWTLSCELWTGRF